MHKDRLKHLAGIDTISEKINVQGVGSFDTVDGIKQRVRKILEQLALDAKDDNFGNIQAILNDGSLQAYLNAIAQNDR